MQGDTPRHLAKADPAAEPTDGYSGTQILALLCRSGVQALSGELRSPDGAVQVLYVLNLILRLFTVSPNL
jgi:hypothetical protein